MAQLTPWALGRHATWLQAIPQAVNGDGTFAPAAGFDAGSLTAPSNTCLLQTGGDLFGTMGSALRVIQGVVDDVTINGVITDANISPLNRPRANHVAFATAHNVQITEILRNGQGEFRPILAHIYQAAPSRIVHFSFVQAFESWDLYLVMLSYTHRLERGKNVSRMALGPVDANIDPNLTRLWNPATGNSQKVVT